MDLVKILENTPVGTPLYSTVFGTVYYKRIENNSESPIRCIDDISRERAFTKDGKYFDGDGECVLFPSKDNRDWTNFHKESFKPFDKVLVRDCVNDPWELTFFAYIDKSDQEGKYCTIHGAHWFNCIPYEGNEHLLGVIEKQ